MSLRAALNVVLHQTRSPDNLGAIARIMANFGFSKLALSDPTTYAFSSAEKLAVRGEAVLAKMKVHRSLEEALEDAVYACGTTSRHLARREALSPEEAVSRLAFHAKRGEVALVFGGEKRGLSDAELSLCHDVLVIPTDAAHPSMNLAQSAAVLLYLCARAGAAGEGDAGGSPEPGAPMATLRALEERMKEVLLAAGYLNPQAPEHILAELWRTLARAGLNRREAELWLAAFKQLGRRP